MELVGSEFTSRILATKNIWLPARDIVKEAIERRNEVQLLTYYSLTTVLPTIDIIH